MPESGQYIRVRGKVTGPFDVASLQKLVRRGALSRMHEVSSDRVNWAPAGEYEELFPAAPEPVAVLAEPSIEDEAAPVAPPQPPPAHESYFYVQNGVTVGPVALNILQALAQNGTLGPQDLCWPEGGQLASSAGQLPALAPIFSMQRSTSRRGNTTSPMQNVGAHGRSAISSASDRWSRTIGIVVAALLLLVLNLPIGTFHDRTIWCWDAMSEPGSGSATVLLFFVLFSALIIGPIALFSSGLLRAWFFVVVAVFSLTLFLELGFQSAAEGSYFFGLFVPFAAAALGGVSAFRDERPEARIGAVFQGIFGGLLVFSLLVLAILALANSPQGSHGLTSTPLPGWVAAVLTMGIIGGIAGLAGGVLGLVGLRQTLSTGVNSATIVCCCASIFFPLLAVVVGVAGNADLFPDQKETAVFLVIRVCAAFACYLALMGTGICELFASYAGAG
jgi:hypothetical protein